MGLVTPGIGLIFWTTLAFLILLVLLRKFAWGPILSAVKEREGSITDSLKAAEKAREEMANLQAENETILKAAKEERAKIIKEAKEVSDRVIGESKETAKIEAGKIVEDAKREIELQKLAALAEVKNEVGGLAISIAEQLIKRELNDKAAQEAFAKEAAANFNLN